MRWILERVSDPEIEPIDLDAMKRHLGEYEAVEKDDDIASLITAAREWAEDYTGRALVDQQWRLTIGDRGTADPVRESVSYEGTLDAIGSRIYLQRAPVIAIVSFVSVDESGAETAVDAATYELREADSKWPYIIGLDGAAWSLGMFRIVYRAGYANRDVSPPDSMAVIPERFKWAMKVWAKGHYDLDERSTALAIETAQRLLDQEKVQLGFA
jgi:putative component of toxin-antitoxin plasmid stabilization module